MALWGPLRVIEGEAGDDGRCLLYLSQEPPPRIHLTDACDLWSCEIAADKPGGNFPENGLGSSKESVSKLREVLAHQTPTLTLRDSVATLCFQDGGQRLAFDLSKVPLSEARKPLQELMFGLVARVHALEERLQASAAPSPVSSPEKATLRGQSIFAPDISPAKCKTGAGQASTKKRLPGESLINPGFKSKKKPKGVDFEDP
ncbi:protein PAXX isoform X2 [Sceloporus undulatus]|uniref:protein PAXX isoform X2 n=1 Tax=Sceloporus undulatus TaxID=8520 RepID=UPI001C4BB8D4|nr:protein PAXX isoform X2 [Sceloporus undulatus]